jgi:predicted nucleotidyltransferase
MSSAPVFRKIVAALDQAGIPYMVVGSFASNLYGAGRATLDIDLVVSANADQIRALLSLLPKAQYYYDVDAAVEACRRKSMFNILDMDRGWKIDIIFQKPGAFHQQAFLRRTAAQIDQVDLFAAKAEDVIISKLEWSKMGGSLRQIEDVAGILKVQGDALNYAEIEKWAKQLGLDQQWAAARGAAGLE